MPLIAGKPSIVEKLPIPEEKTNPTPEVSLGQVLQLPTIEQLQNESSENPAEVVPQETKLPESKAEEQELEATPQENLDEEPLSDEDLESNHVVFVPPHASDQSGFGIFGMSPHRSILLICAAVLLGILIFIFLFYLLNNNGETSHGNPSVQVNPVPIAKPKPQPPKPSPKVEAPSPLTLAGSGKLQEAASLWKTSLSEEKNKYTLQLILACQPKTVQDLIQALGNSENIKLLPADYQGQSCYRVVYGIYDSPESAAVAIPGLPQSFAGRRIQARIVLISKLLQ
jgi:septal ring-binding cell division protein DamX